MRRLTHPPGIVAVGFGAFYAQEKCLDRHRSVYVSSTSRVICIVLGCGHRSIPFVLGPTFVGWKLFDWELEAFQSDRQ